MPRRRWWLVLLAVATACHPAPASDAPREVASAARATPRVLLDTPLLYAEPGGDGKRPYFHAAVRARVGSRDTLLIVDTGASDTVLTRALAVEIGANLQPTEPGVDHAGALVPSWRIAGRVPVVVGGASLAFEAPIVIEGPPPFAAWGLGGIVSPQELHPTAHLVIDLATRRLQLVEGGLGELARQVSARYPTHLRLSLPRLGRSGDAHRLVITMGMVDGGAEAPFLMNTGGSHVELAPSLLSTGLEGGREVPVVGVGGQGEAGTIVPGRSLRFGEASLPVPEILVREQGQDYAGQIGLHAMEGSVLVVSPDRGEPLLWWLPAR